MVPYRYDTLNTPKRVYAFAYRAEVFLPANLGTHATLSVWWLAGRKTKHRQRGRARLFFWSRRYRRGRWWLFGAAWLFRRNMPDPINHQTHWILRVRREWVVIQSVVDCVFRPAV
ncbi:hypothetical protein, partial [Actinotignum sp. GS-2025b]|uniref:hypothetical protein n=1 Tax=Actinotignum sp. GS-2025b TaxID=3427275 RepID=UPI003F4C1A96